MKILYLGAQSGTSKHRSNALVRLGHQVLSIDPQAFVPRNQILAKLHWETGALFCSRQVARGVLGQIRHQQFDFVWVDNGRYVGPRLVTELKRRSDKVINYNVDDPFGWRDRFSWQLYLKTVPFYDLVVVVRSENIQEGYQRGARKVLRVFRSADEVAHAPRLLTAADHDKWSSQVVFVGTWFPERGPLMKALIEKGVPLSIYGDRWQKAAEWPSIKPFWRGPGTKTDDEYAKAVQGSKICLGLLSKGNRDLHTQRSLEIPYLGGLLCAERTVEHQQLYKEGEEAVFWSSPEECAQRCLDLLRNEDHRQRIACQGHLRNLQNDHLNEKTMAHVIDQVC